MKLIVNKIENAKGILEISGSKNAALAIMCGSLVSKNKVILTNVPQLTDVYNLINILRDSGCIVKQMKNKLIIKARKFNPEFLMKDVQMIRASYYLMGVSLLRYDKCIIKNSGGCNFCERPIDLHLMAFNMLGYKTVIEKDFIYLYKEKEVQRATIRFKKKSVGATINTIFASLNKEEVLIENPSLEPEVLDVISFLNCMGSNISIENNTLIIRKERQLKRIKYKVMYDRIEAGSYLLLLSTVENVNVRIKNMPFEEMKEILKVVGDLGIKLRFYKNDIIVYKDKSHIRRNYNINVYPSFPTDLQQILTCCILKEKRSCIIRDYVYPERVSHLKEINSLGGNVEFNENKIRIYPSEIKGGIVNSNDLRCCFAMICLGQLTNEGVTIKNSELLFRGYEFPLLKLNKLGFKVKTID